MKRVMCVRFPDWPIWRILAAQPELRNRPLVLYTEDGKSGRRVTLCCRAAAARGIATGLPLAEAQGLLESPRRSSAPAFLAHRPEDDWHALRQLAVWSQRFSPVVGIEGTDSLVLDLSGCTHLFGGERRLARQLSRGLARWGLAVRTAIADTLGAAWAVAGFGNAETTIVRPGQQQAALRRLPVQALRLPAAALRMLGELDVRRIEQLQALPRASLSSRFGPEVARRLDQALGDVAELIEPVRPPEPIEARWDFEHPTADRKSLAAALRKLVEQLAGTLAATQQGAQRLDVHLVGTTKQETHFTVGMLRPCQSTVHLMELVQTRLEQTSLRETVAGVWIQATVSPLLERHQSRLFDAGDHPGGRRKLAELIDRLSNRLGQQNVVRPLPCPDAQPEYAIVWKPLLADAHAELRPLTLFETWPAAARPLRLFKEPLAIEATSFVPAGPPLRFRWQEGVHTIARWWGPERIETGWWRARHVRRDYYQVETQSGQRFWLFRRIDRDDWFLHGEFE